MFSSYRGFTVNVHTAIKLLSAVEASRLHGEPLDHGRGSPSDVPMSSRKAVTAAISASNIYLAPSHIAVTC